jgi:Concanavalin A-like lectin/glucanases superfamily
MTMNGSSQYLYGNTSYVNPTTYSVEAWFKTSTVSGGVIAGFHSPQVGTAVGGQSDRLIYMNNAGLLYFGVYNTGVHTIHTTVAFNNGAAHHVVVTFSSAGMVMYADGAQVASDATVTTEQSYTGWWRAGEADLTGWDSAPTSNYFNGTIDEFAVYPTALSLQKVQVHYCDGANVNCLSMAAPTTVVFSATTLNGLDQTKTVFATFDITDNTGGNGWNVTATSTTFTNGPRQLSTSATTVASAPSSVCDTGFTCAAPTDSVSYPYTLPAGASAPTATKLINAAVASGFGHETITATFTLTVPGNAYVGAYLSTWTFNLVSGP